MLVEVGGYEVEPIRNGEDVLNNFQQRPDLFIIDIWMSGVNGKDLCKKLKSNPETSDIPVMLFSANRDLDEIAQEAGADEHLRKPFHMKELLQKVERLVSGY